MKETKYAGTQTEKNLMAAFAGESEARIIPPVVFSLEEALEYIKEDEYVEVTPKSMRMRKVEAPLPIR